MGISYYLVTSDGEFVENPKHLFNYLIELRIENRKLSRMKKEEKSLKRQVNRFSSNFEPISEGANSDGS